MEAGAKIHFSDDPQDSSPVVFTRWARFEVLNYSPLIYANDCDNIAVTDLVSTRNALPVGDDEVCLKSGINGDGQRG